MSCVPPRVILRDSQLKTLDAFIDQEKNPDLFPNNIVVQGFKSSGKSYCLREYFKALPKDVNFCAFVTRYEIFSWKNLLTSIARNSYHVLRTKFPDWNQGDKIDPLSAEDFYLLTEFFSSLFQGYDGALSEDQSFYVVIDNLDALPQMDFLVFARLVKAHESISYKLKLKLKFIFTIENISFYDKYRTFDLPLVVFPRYTQDEIQQILEFHHSLFSESHEFSMLRESLGVSMNGELLSKNYLQFIVESFYSYTGSDVESLKDIAVLKWPKFLKRVTKTNYDKASELYKSNIDMWTSTGDKLDEKIEEIRKDDLDEPATKKARTSNSLSQSFTLSNLTKYVLISAYLGSYLDCRFDAKNFSKKVFLRQGRSAYGSRVKQKLQPETMKPNSSTVERLLAILQAIYTFDRRNEEFVGHDDEQKLTGEYFNYADSMRANVEVYESMAELISLKLILPSKTQYPDFLDSKTRWKANLPWENILEIAKSVDFDIEEYFEFQ